MDTTNIIDGAARRGSLAARIRAIDPDRRAILEEAIRDPTPVNVLAAIVSCYIEHQARLAELYDITDGLDERVADLDDAVEELDTAVSDVEP